jgi:1-pyrroline-5-carboxylate dehydrogenase
MSEFKLTYATMFSPPDELHTNFDAALNKVKQHLGKEFGLLINGQDMLTDKKMEDRSPINKDWVLAILQKGDESHAKLAMDSARKAFPIWSHTRGRSVFVC